MSSRIVGRLNRQQKPMLGVFQPDSSGKWSELQKFESSIGRRVSIVHWFAKQGTESWSMAGKKVNPLLERNQIPLITYEMDRPSDLQYRVAANMLRQIPGTVYLRPFHEMNADWYPWGIPNVGLRVFLARWKRLATTMGNIAPNVRLVWCPNVGAIDPQSYPGDQYVDVVGVDGYNHPDRGGWKSLDDKIRWTYNDLRQIAPDKKIWVCETACHDRGGDKPAWIRNMGQTTNRLPDIDAVVWFNENKSNRNWAIDSPPEALYSFRDAVRDWR